MTSSRRRFLFPVLTIAAGITSLGASEGIVLIFRAVNTSNLREWLAADLAVITSEPPDATQLQLLAGLNTTTVIESVGQVRSDGVPTPQVAMVRVVDTGKYPFYGKVRLSPSLDLKEALTGETIAVSEEVLHRLEIQVGSEIELNRVRFRVAAVVRSVPDQLGLLPTPLPKVLLSMEAAHRADLLRWNGIHYEHILVRLSPGSDLAMVRSRLDAAFPSTKILDHLHPDPQLADIVDRMALVLRSISLLALLVGTFGVAMAVWMHLDASLDAIAIKKMLGASTWKLVTIYGFETLLVTAAGSAVGLFCAVAAERMMAGALRSFLSLDVEFPWDWTGPGRAAAQGMLASIVALGPVFAKIRSVRPYAMLRREVDEPFYAQPLCFSLAALLLLIAAVQQSWGMALLTLPGLLVLAAGLAGLTELCLLVLGRLRRRTPPPLRHGIEHLLRPGIHARVSIVAMSTGIALMLSSYLIAYSATGSLSENLPPSAARLLLLNLRPEQIDQVEKLLASAPGATQAPVILPFFVTRPLTVDGRPAGLGRRWLAAGVERSFGIVDLVEGKWWSPQEPAVQVALPRALARAMRARVGSRMEFESGSKRITARVAALFSAGGFDRLRCCLLFNRALHDPGGLVYHGLAAVSPEASPAVREAIYRQFPTVITIDGSAASQLFERWVESMLWVIRLIGVITMACAAVLTSAVIFATAKRRMGEVAIWRALGARSSQLVWMHVAEFTTMGVVAGLIAALVATLTTVSVWSWIADEDWRWPSVSMPVFAIVAGAAMSNVIGWLAVRRASRQTPLQTLRQE